MDSGRFETFVDAILAIIITVMVLHFSQPELPTWQSFWELRVVFFAHLISFACILSVWDHHRKLFAEIKKIDNVVVSIYMVLVFLLTLIPYFTSWVAHNPEYLVPEVVYGIMFVLVNILYVIAAHVAIKRDVSNDNLQDISYSKVNIVNYSLFIVAFIIAFAGYPQAILIACLLSMFVWNFLGHFTNHDDEVCRHGN